MIFRIVLALFLCVFATNVMAKQINSIQIERETQRPGGDYTKFNSKNATHCARVCANDYRCQAFDFDKTNRMCYLKDKVPYPRQNWNIVSGFKEINDYGGGNYQLAGFRLDRGMARTGSDYAKLSTQNVRQCASSCANDYHCQAFDFNRYDRVCYLKDRVPPLFGNQDVVSGVKQDTGYDGDIGFGGNGIPAWAIGHFQGHNERDQTAASIFINSSGDVNARWNGQSHRGYFDGQVLHLEGRDFIVRQRGNGFETILRSDRGNRVYFHRQNY